MPVASAPDDALPQGHGMTPPLVLLESKLFIPRPQRRLVPRRRLTERLDQGAESPLTLISAPAGFGKSTLLSDWLATDSRPAAWLALDAGDNDPSVFWAYFVAALRTVAPSVRDAAWSDASRPGVSHDVLTGILNDVSALTTDVVLVLDDYHVIVSAEVHDGVAFVLDHLPPQLHLVIASRVDPSLPLARLRARGGLVEVRAADLRFTADEASAYFGEAMALSVSEADVATLSIRTEGWIAALQLAAISMRGRDDLAAFVASFAGDDRYVVDYLVEEVLQNQPAPVRDFLLRTSILHRMTASLCDVVTGLGGGVAMLETLDRANLFLVPLDDRRRWYRYHHLFGEVLQARLLDEHPEVVPELHRRASDWYAQHGELEAAIRHALAAPDYERAAQLIESAHLESTRHRRESTLREWMEALPVEIFRTRPVLSLGFVGALLSTGKIEGVEARLRDAEQWADVASGGQDPLPDDLRVVDQEEFRRLPASIAIYRAGLAQSLGDSEATARFALRALELISDDDPFRRGAASALHGLSLWGTGALEEAHDAYAEAVSCFRRSGHVADVLGCTIVLADVRLTQGRLSDAMAHYDEALRLARERGGPTLRGVPDMHVGMSEVLLERGELQAAAQHLGLAREVGEHLGLPKYRYRSRLAMAQLQWALGDSDGALTLYDEAEATYVADLAPDVRPVAAFRVRALLAQGAVAEAASWARQRRLSAEDDLTYLREFEHMTLARLLIAQSQHEGGAPLMKEAQALLERLGRAAEAAGRVGNAMEILVVHSLALRVDGDLDGALALLERAVRLAAPEGHVRVFVDEGAPMKALLQLLTSRAEAPSHARALLTAFGRSAASAPSPSSAPGIHEPLSEREREVLRLLGTEMNGPEIARHLVVSLNTLRTHTKNIYAKLGVNNRRAAVRRAAEGEQAGAENSSR